MLGALIQPPPPTSPSAAMRSLPTCGSPPLSSSARGSTCHRRSASLYEVLRVKHTATPSEIKAAYRSLAKVYHPDAIIRSAAATESADEWGIQGSSGGGEFMGIHEAYVTLSDPAARAVYDLTLGLGGRRRHGHGLGVLGRVGCRPTRRWETDQCW